MKDPRLVLGIDGGGLTGAALWGVDGPVWHTQGAPWDVAHAIACRRNLPHVSLVVLEGIFVSPKSVSGALATAHKAGLVQGALAFTGIPRAVLSDPWRPPATEWRKALGWQRMSSPVAKNHARAHAGVVTGQPDWFRTKRSSNEAEAICMAEAGWCRLVG